MGSGHFTGVAKVRPAWGCVGGCGMVPVFLNSLMSAGVMGLYDLPLRILAMLSPSVMYSSGSGRLGGDTLRSCSGQQHPACPAEAVRSHAERQCLAALLLPPRSP